MAGQSLQTTAFVLGRAPTGSDKFEQVPVFSATEGLLLCLRRQSTKTAGQATPLDLFDEAELWLESSNQGRTWFIKEHRHLTRHPGIGRSYAALQAAASLARLIQRNPVPDESRAPIAALLCQTFHALDRGHRPDLVWLKALYCFLRDEGYPVKQHWWQQLAAGDRILATQLLHQPLAGQEPDATLVRRLTRHLTDWVARDTELRIE
jgi:recombinational DNA repair protein (RecF pathway)